MQRTVTPELLDGDEGTPQEIAASLADLRRINRMFGGIATTVKLLTKVARRLSLKTLSVLDVGSASGDVPLGAQQSLAREGIEVSLTLLDRSITHLPPTDANQRGVRKMVGDALALPFSDSTFDVVSCSLLIHHFDPEELRAFLRQAIRIARSAVVINDLRRSPMHLALVYAGFPLFRSRITRFDGPASVRRAYTEHELKGIVAAVADELGCKADFSRHYLYRIGVVVWK